MIDYKHPVSSSTLGSRWGDPNRKAFHYGDDYKVGTATVVRAIADGVCIISGQHRLWGFYTQIEHADGRVSSYHQLQRYGRPVQGQEVVQGQQVGRPGLPLNDVESDIERESNTIWSGAARFDSAGNRVSTGAHLHLGIMAGIGKPWVNPATVIRTSSAATAPAGGDSTPITPEGFLMALSDRQQQDLYDRVMGFNVQRYDANKAPARAMDSLDGDFLRKQLDTVISNTSGGPTAFARIMGVLRSRKRPDGKTTAYVLDELDGERLLGETSSAFHQLVALITKGGSSTDAAAIATELNSTLGATLANQVVQELGKQLAGK